MSDISQHTGIYNVAARFRKLNQRIPKTQTACCVTLRLRDGLAHRIADGLAQLTPEQREALRSALTQRLAAEVREGLSDRLADRLSDRLDSAMPLHSALQVRGYWVR